MCVTSGKEVVISRKAGEAVLRGAPVFVPGEILNVDFKTRIVGLAMFLGGQILLFLLHHETCGAVYQWLS